MKLGYAFISQDLENLSENRRGAKEASDHALNSHSYQKKIGEVLLSKNIITKSQLDIALEEQARNGGRLGTILVSLGYISSNELSQNIPALFGSKLGERLVEIRAISIDQLNTALSQQKESGELLGQVLVSLGYITQETLDNNLLLMDQQIPIGEILIKHNEISSEQLKKAIEFQNKSGGLLGDIFLSLRMVSSEVLYRYLAIQKQMGRPGRQIDISQSKNLPFETAYKYNIAVISVLEDRYLLATTARLGIEILYEIEKLLQKPVEQVLVSQIEIDEYWANIYGKDLEWHISQKLATEKPHNSALRTFTLPQIIFAVLLFCSALFGFIVKTFTTVLILNSVIQLTYFVMIVFKMAIMVKGMSKDSQIRISQKELGSLDEKDLPIYTVLLPIYKERKIASRLISNIDSLDYPKSKLDVRLLLEENDFETIEAVRSVDLPSYYTILIVPDSLPKTKPKACNYGLIHAKGEYVVIFDAEDKPEPDQLKKAFLAFRKLPDKTICIQAKLNYYNSQQNLITKWFTHEYSMWFELLLPGVMQFDIPLPLGGSSNHFKTQKLKEIGAWDPFNVTEDADLGIRLFKDGYKTAVMASRTWEEAPSSISGWIKQRSRWLKGYMQTWLVHMRNPFKLIRDVGIKGFMGFQAMVFGTVFLPLVNPVFWLLLILWIITQAGWIATLFPGIIYYAALFLLVIGNFSLFMLVWLECTGSSTIWLNEIPCQMDAGCLFRMEY